MMLIGRLKVIAVGVMAAAAGVLGLAGAGGAVAARWPGGQVTVQSGCREAGERAGRAHRALDQRCRRRRLWQAR